MGKRTTMTVIICIHFSVHVANNSRPEWSLHTSASNATDNLMMYPRVQTTSHNHQHHQRIAGINDHRIAHPWYCNLVSHWLLEDTLGLWTILPATAVVQFQSDHLLEQPTYLGCHLDQWSRRELIIIILVKSCFVFRKRCLRDIESIEGVMSCWIENLVSHITIKSSCCACRLYVAFSK